MSFSARAAEYHTYSTASPQHATTGPRPQAYGREISNDHLPLPRLPGIQEVARLMRSISGLPPNVPLAVEVARNPDLSQATSPRLSSSGPRSRGEDVEPLSVMTANMRLESPSSGRYAHAPAVDKSRDMYHPSRRPSAELPSFIMDMNEVAHLIRIASGMGGQPVHHQNHPNPYSSMHYRF